MEDRFGRRKVYYTHHLGKAAQIGKQLYAMAAQAGVAECARIVALGDGASWIWRQIRLHFPHAVQVLNFYHASGHLSDVLRACMNIPAGTEIASNAQAGIRLETGIKIMRAGKQR